jgi:Domain of unknown function (DUF389)
VISFGTGDLLDLLPAHFVIGQSALPDLTTDNGSIILVALAAGVAGVLPLEAPASSVVGVAISITTIPAAAYLGAAAGARETVRASGALAVLGVNIAVLVLPGTLPLAAQRRLACGCREPWHGR